MATATHDPAALLAIGLPAQVAASGVEALSSALRLVLESGHAVQGPRPYREVLNAQLVLTHPYGRLVPPGWTSFDPRVAVARLVWHLRGSSALDEIAFYEPRVTAYSDDGVTIPGSNVGARLLGRVNQLKGAIERLRDDESTRRASMVVWEPDDAVRRSRDIPCAFGLTLHVRDGRLLVTALMRSNNALRLLPYNMFELGLLGEIAAADLGLPLGPYMHVAQSLHVFDDELERARMLVDHLPEPGPPMSVMPSDDVWGQMELLVDSEERLRRGEPVLDEAAERLDPYWFAFLVVLARGSAGREATRYLRERSPDHPFLSYVRC